MAGPAAWMASSPWTQLLAAGGDEPSSPAHTLGPVAPSAGTTGRGPAHRACREKQASHGPLGALQVAQHQPGTPLFSFVFYLF